MSGDRALLTFAYMIGTTERVQFSTSSDSVNAFAVWRIRIRLICVKTGNRHHHAPVDGQVRETNSAETPLTELEALLEKSQLTGA